MAEVEAETRRGRKASWMPARSTPSSCRAEATREVELSRAARVVVARASMVRVVTGLEEWDGATWCSSIATVGGS